MRIEVNQQMLTLFHCLLSTNQWLRSGRMMQFLQSILVPCPPKFLYFFQFPGTAVVPLVARQKSGCILGDSSLMSEVICFNAFLHESAVFRLIGRTQRNRLSVSTATKRKFTPLFGRASCCTSAKSTDQISLSLKV